MNPATLLCVASLAISATITAPDGAPNGASAASSILLPPSPGESTAWAARKAARDDAKAEFWLAIAKALNAGLDLEDAEEAAWQARQDAFELADEQYDARIDLLEDLGGAGYCPQLDPLDFSPTVDNPFFPLVPGRTMIYEKQTAEGLEVVQVTTQGTTTIAGFSCRVIRDVVTVNGVFKEDTFDWYAQQDDGEVWYFGEIAQNFEDGLLDNLDGSWRTDRDGAKPGIIMPASPVVGAVYRQEFLVNEAEDVAEVLALDETVVVPYGVFTGCLKTEDWSPLEPGHVEHKYYAPGLGFIKSVNLQTGETLELVGVSKN